MYKIQFINVFTKEILREATHNSVEPALRMIRNYNACQNHRPKGTIYLFDERKRTLDATFLSFDSYREKDGTHVIRLYFKVKLAKVQAVIHDFDEHTI